MYNILIYNTIFLLIISLVNCVTHWKITDNGRIESNEDSAFALLRPYDLASFIKQVDRYERLNILKEILASKETINKREKYKNTPISVASYQENFYKTDQDCINAGQQLAKFSFYESHFVTWRSDVMKLPKEIIEIDQAEIKIFKKPYCDVIDLPFTMGTFDHLESIQSRLNITMLPETELSSNLLVDSEELFGHMIYKSLNINSTSWVFLTMASDYFRIKGDYSNSIMCLQRAIYFSQRRHRSIPLLNLANMLHKLHFINDSLVIGLTSVSLNAKNSLLAYYVANIYVTLGQLNVSYTWYNRAANSDPEFHQAALKKSAVACHIKLQMFLEEQHVNLQNKLEELNSFQGYSDEWFQLNNKLILEKSSSNRKKFTQNIYNEFITNSESTICYWHKLENDEISKMICKKLPIHYTHFPFYNHTKLVELLEAYETSQDSSKKTITCSSIDDDECRDHIFQLEPINSVRNNKEIIDAMSLNLEKVINDKMHKNQVFFLDGSVNQNN